MSSPIRRQVVSTVRSSAFRTSSLSFANITSMVVEIGAVGRQEEEMRACIKDRVTGRLALVASQVVPNDHVAVGQRWKQALWTHAVKAMP